jgi:hypothetical protein
MRLPIFLGLSVLPVLCQAEVTHESPPQILPLALTGPAYEIANQAYSAYNDKDYDLAIAKAQGSLASTQRCGPVAQADPACRTRQGPSRPSRALSRQQEGLSEW